MGDTSKQKLSKNTSSSIQTLIEKLRVVGFEDYLEYWKKTILIAILQLSAYQDISSEAEDNFWHI